MGDTGYAKEVLVSTDWLAEHLADPGVVVAEVDENPALYDEGHVRGAVRLHWRDDLQDPVLRDLVDRPAFERLMGGLGISIVSTPSGLMTDAQARAQGLGGEVIGRVA